MRGFTFEIIILQSFVPLLINPSQAKGGYGNLNPCDPHGSSISAGTLVGHSPSPSVNQEAARSNTLLSFSFSEVKLPWLPTENAAFKKNNQT